MDVLYFATLENKKKESLLLCRFLLYSSFTSDYFGIFTICYSCILYCAAKSLTRIWGLFFVSIRIPPVGALSKSRILLDKLLCHCTRLNLTCLLAQSGGKSVWGSRKKGSRHGFYICFILPVLNLRPVVFANSLVGSV